MMRVRMSRSLDDYQTNAPVLLRASIVRVLILHEDTVQRFRVVHMQPLCLKLMNPAATKSEYQS